MNKKLLSERDNCSKNIAPAIQQVSWNMHRQLLEAVSFTEAGQRIALCRKFKKRLKEGQQLHDQLANTIVEQAVA